MTQPVTLTDADLSRRLAELLEPEPRILQGLHGPHTFKRLWHCSRDEVIGPEDLVTRAGSFRVLESMRERNDETWVQFVWKLPGAISGIHEALRKITPRAICEAALTALTSEQDQQTGNRPY